MSPRELPLWARGASAVLLVFASWWLVHTEAIRDVVGGSVGAVGLGIVAAFILRGMHLPLGIWPEGPWRQRFVAWIVIAAGAVVALLLLFSRPAASPALMAQLDPGTYVLVIAGTIGWGFSLALVRQRPFGRWFLIAVGAALIPYLVGLAGVRIQGGGWPAMCLLSEGAGVAPATCEAGALRVGAFALATYGTTALVTYEVAFRRLLLGRDHGAGLVLVLGVAVVFTLWTLLTSSSSFVPPSAPIAGLIAIAAGGLYAISGSLLVSATYAALVGGVGALVGAPGGVGDVSVALPLREAWLVASVAVTGMVAILVVRRNGVLGGIRPSEDDVSGEEPDPSGAQGDVSEVEVHASSD